MLGDGAELQLVQRVARVGAEAEDVVPGVEVVGVDALGFAREEAFFDGFALVGAKGLLVDQGLEGCVLGVLCDGREWAVDGAVFELVFVAGCEGRVDVDACGFDLLEEPAVRGVDGPDPGEFEVCLGDDRSA